MFIDLLYLVADAPISPGVDFTIHVVIVAVEIVAPLTVLSFARRDDDSVAVPAA